MPQFFTYRLPLTAPLDLQGRESHRLTHRKGLLIRHEREGRVDWGEAAPLPGFSQEEFREVLFRVQESSEDCASLIMANQTLPEVTDAIEIPVNALLAGSPAAVCAEAEKISAEVPVVKVKVGRQRVADDIKWVQQLRALLPSSTRLRLDANQAWSFDEAQTFVQGISEVEIEYLEEPLENYRRLPELKGVPIALDESLMDPDRLCWIECASALVLKPTLLGNVEPLIRQSKGSGRKIVFSAAFESGVGIRNIARTALLFDSKPEAMGLDTYRWLAEDVLTERLRFEPGKMILPSCRDAAYTVDLSKLQPINL
jgi:O-succinylbenzoate synthase